jgi:hypothetical protein
MRRGFSFLVQKRCFKIADKKRSVALELTEDERFFRENDVDPTIAFIESLERERAVLEEKERQGEATAEWQEYDKEVEAVIHQIEHQWLTNPEPITKDSVKRAHKVMEEAVSKVCCKAVSFICSEKAQKKRSSKNIKF